MAVISLCEEADRQFAELAEFSSIEELAVSHAISSLEIDSFRKEHQVDFCIVEGGYELWAVLVGYVWLVFCERGDGVEIVHISLLSKFRRG